MSIDEKKFDFKIHMLRDCVLTILLGLRLKDIISITKN